MKRRPFITSCCLAPSAGPGTKYRMFQRLHAGQGANDGGSQGTKGRVNLPGGTTGWASSRHLN